MRLTPSDAARLFGIHRATLYRHMAAGRLSWVLEPNGSRALDMSELIRCYGEPSGHATPSATPATPTTGDDATPATERLLAELVELTRHQGEELRRLREEVATLRRLPPPPDQGERMNNATRDNNDDPNGLRALVQALRDDTPDDAD
ncbi:hypothetical protein SAMN04487952_12611 [Halomonas caseinilytica]|nr:hypothetical protein SAMN04487952_12611 [Halomonas caseinilytica]